MLEPVAWLLVAAIVAAVASPTFFSNSAFAFISSGVSTGCPVAGSTTKNSA